MHTFTSTHTHTICAVPFTAPTVALTYDANTILVVVVVVLFGCRWWCCHLLAEPSVANIEEAISTSSTDSQGRRPDTNELALELPRPRAASARPVKQAESVN